MHARSVHTSKPAMCGQGNTERAWIRARRLSVDNLVGNARSSLTGDVSAVLQRAKAAAGEHWGATCAAEEAFLVKKEGASKVDSFRMKHLLPHEVDEGLDTLAETAVVKTARLVRDARSRCQSVEETLQRGGGAHRATELTMGRAVFVDLAFATDTRIATAIDDHGLRVIANNRRCRAELFVVPNPANAGQRTTWAAMLVGARVCSAEFLISSGRSGSSVKYKPAIVKPCFLWISPAFRAAQPALTEIIRTAVELPCSHWAICIDADLFFQRANPVRGYDRSFAHNPAAL
jgi:hypothetical protein